MATAKLNDGVIDLETTLQDYPMLIGNLLSYVRLRDCRLISLILTDLPSRRRFCLSALIAIIGSLIWPENYDWAETRALHAHHAVVVEESLDSSLPAEDEDKEKTNIVPTPMGGCSAAPSLKGTGMDLEFEPPVPVHEDSPEHIAKTFRFATWTAVSAFVILMILYVHDSDRRVSFPG